VERFVNKTEDKLLQEIAYLRDGGHNSNNNNHNNHVHVDAEDLVPHVHPPASASASGVGEEMDEDAVHIVFSTDCTPYQDWQTLVMFHSAKTVGQRGPITRIASGCNDDEKKVLTELYAKLWPQYHVHFTPDFKKDAKSNKKYDFYNKPYGLKHWLEEAHPPVQSGTVIALLDPDMVLLRPITTRMAGQQNNIVSKPVMENEIFARAGRGHAVGQTYGLGAPWTNDNHKKFNRGKICGEGSPCLDVVNEREGWKYFSVGPPYIVERDDFLRLANTWTTFVPRVYEGYPYLLAEMYAYSMAAAHEKLPHLRMDHFMVSNTGAGGEGWPWVDGLEDVCVPPNEDGIFFPGQPLPTVVHYCQNFRAGDYAFQKRRMSKTAFTCDHPLFVDLPKDLGYTTYRIKDGKKEDLDKKQVKRNAFVICAVYRAINAAMVDFKERACGDDATRSDKKEYFLVS